MKRAKLFTILYILLISTSPHLAVANTTFSIKATSLSPSFSQNQTDYTLRKCHQKKVSIKLEIPGNSNVTVDGEKVTQGAVMKTLKKDQLVNITITEKNIPRQYFIRCLPDDFPEISVIKHSNTAPKSQYLLASGNRTNPKTWELVRKYYMILDESGVPLWYMKAEGFPAIIEKASNNSVYTLASPEGLNPSYAARGNPGIIATNLNGSYISALRQGEKTPIDGHSLKLLPNGSKLLITVRLEKNVDLSKTFNQLTALDVAGGGIKDCSLEATNSATVAYPEIRIVDKKGKTTWYWDSKGNIQNDESILPAVTNIDYTGKTNCIIDLFHASHVSLSEDGKTILLTTRFTSSTYGIDFNSKKILWKVGGTKTPYSLKIEKDPLDKEGPRGHHGGELNKENLLILFDNRREISQISRGVMYQLNLNDRKAEYKNALMPVQKPCTMLENDVICSSYSMGGASFTKDGYKLVSWGFKLNNPNVATLYDAKDKPVLTIQNTFGVHTTYKVSYLSEAERFDKNILRVNASSDKVIRASWKTTQKPVTNTSDVAVGTIK